MLRTHSTDMLWAIGDWYVIQTNMVAEVRALFQGLQKCVLSGVHCVDIEVGSPTLVHIF